jgi:hypothetical protein
MVQGSIIVVVVVVAVAVMGSREHVSGSIVLFH